MKAKTRFAVLCLAAILVLAQGTVNAIEIVFTENSSTDLTATLDGTPLSVFNVSEDRWTMSLPLGSFFDRTSPGIGQWIEPENSSLINRATGVFTSINIQSDLTRPATLAFADGTRVSFGRMTSPMGSGEVFATYFDRANGTSVPDAGSTAALLGLALLGIEGFRRRVRTA